MARRATQDSSSALVRESILLVLRVRREKRSSGEGGTDRVGPEANGTPYSYQKDRMVQFQGPGPHHFPNSIKRKILK